MHACGTLDYPGASATQAFGVNDHDEVVGAYTDGTGSTASLRNIRAGYGCVPRR